MIDYYYHVKTTHGSYNAMKSDAANEHSKNAPNHLLSVIENLAGTEALIKVRASDDYSPGWENAPFVIRKYTRADQQEAHSMLQGPDWLAEE